jgi:hypothetical protein
MQKYAGTCSPEQLQTLQKIFDLIWMELRSSSLSNFNGPSDPDTLRAEIASRVLSCHDGDDLDAQHITERVLSSFGIETSILHPPTRGGNGVMKSHLGPQ